MWIINNFLALNFHTVVYGYEKKFIRQKLHKLKIRAVHTLKDLLTLKNLHMQKYGFFPKLYFENESFVQHVILQTS